MTAARELSKLMLEQKAAVLAGRPSPFLAQRIDQIARQLSTRDDAVELRRLMEKAREFSGLLSAHMAGHVGARIEPSYEETMYHKEGFRASSKSLVNRHI